MNANLRAPCTRKHRTHCTAVPDAHPVPGGRGAASKGDRQLPCLSQSGPERPRGGLPPRLWADPSSLAGQCAEGKGVRRSRWLPPTALFLVVVVPVGPPRPRLKPQEIPVGARVFSGSGRGQRLQSSPQFPGT
ncbi:hypothetical protein P4O66_021845 [Electrophorus voltai]|uniref:Uncharacterized protein n=1 Tax=Electrophorus voltai TaxID=2609070 RepID=A0AAD9E4Q5_9TELE|nr:hypothetical protein P4O66_021845 [Electrophorus voltai]